MNLLKRTANVIIVVGLILGSCDTDNINDQNRPCFTGQGNIVTETFNPSSFSSISFAVPGNLQITQGAAQPVVISGQSNVFDELIVRVVNNELQIEIDRCVGNMTPLEIQVAIPDIESLSIAGAGSITSQNAFDLDNLSLSIAGQAEVTLMGQADNFDIDIAGSADIYTFDFVVDNCQVDIAGEATVEVQVSDVLTVNIAGSGTVFYKGDPTITSNISGSGMLVDAN